MGAASRTRLRGSCSRRSPPLPKSKALGLRWGDQASTRTARAAADEQLPQRLAELGVEPPLRLHQGRLRQLGRVLEAVGQARDPTVDVPQELLAVSQGGTRRPEGLLDAIGQRGDVAIDTPRTSCWTSVSTVRVAVTVPPTSSSSPGTWPSTREISRWRVATV